MDWDATKVCVLGIHAWMVACSSRLFCFWVVSTSAPAKERCNVDARVRLTTNDRWAKNGLAVSSVTTNQVWHCVSNVSGRHNLYVYVLLPHIPAQKYVFCLASYIRAALFSGMQTTCNQPKPTRNLKKKKHDFWEASCLCLNVRL